MVVVMVVVVVVVDKEDKEEEEEEEEDAGALVVTLSSDSGGMEALQWLARSLASMKPPRLSSRGSSVSVLVFYAENFALQEQQQQQQQPWDDALNPSACPLPLAARGYCSGGMPGSGHGSTWIAFDA